jgi:hypothetical protein
MMPAFNSGGDNEPFSDNLHTLEDLYVTTKKKFLQLMLGPVLKAMQFEMQALACMLLHEMEEQVKRRKKKTTTPRLLPLRQPKKTIVVSVLLLLDATALVNRTTRWLSPFSRSTLMKKKKKNAIAAWNTMSVELLWKKSMQKMTMHHVKCSIR